MTAFGTMEAAIAAIRAGAYDFLIKPLDINRLGHTVEQALRHRELSDEVTRLRQEAVTGRPVSNLIGQSKVMRRIKELIGQVAAPRAKGRRSCR